MILSKMFKLAFLLTSLLAKSSNMCCTYDEQFNFFVLLKLNPYIMLDFIGRWGDIGQLSSLKCLTLNSGKTRIDFGRCDMHPTMGKPPVIVHSNDIASFTFAVNKILFYYCSIYSVYNPIHSNGICLK